MQNILTTIVVSLHLFNVAQAQEAGDLGVAVGSKKELILTGESCDVLLKQQVALCAWKKKINPAFVSKPLDKSCQLVKKGKYKLAVLDCLPEFARDYQSVKLSNSGPNCWGTAMSFHQLSIKPRFMWPQEMQYWMTSPLCRKLDVNEPRLPGDVINVYAPEKIPSDDRVENDPGTDFWRVVYPNRYIPAPPPEVTGSDYTGYHRLLHSVTYVSDQLAFGKDSPAFDDLFYFHAMGQVYGRPKQGNVECQENQSMGPYFREYQQPPKDIRGSKCSYFSQAYRCSNFNDYFAFDKMNEDNQKRWINIQALQKFQEKLFPLMASSKNKMDAREVTLIADVANTSFKKTTQELGKPNLDKTQEELLVLEYFSAAGLLKTLEQLKLIKSSL